MCGIVGKLNFNSSEVVNKELIRQMCNEIVHRGPDDSGYFIDRNFGLGMRRLSVIDLSTGSQPIFNEDKSKVIVFNGEIYNFQEVKAVLLKKGHKFKTESDTETILHAYEEYGEKCLEKLNGMFAIAIWDTKNKQLFLARDRIGIKPLYYYLDNEKLVFGSELKAIIKDKSIKRELNMEGLDLYLSYMYVPCPHSIFKNIYKLPPAHYLIAKNGKTHIHSYWDVDFKPNYQKSEADLIDEFNYLLNDSVKSQMISDVPLGAFLSGGVDSSAIVAKMSQNSSKPIKTFSIGFKEGGYYDETKYAEMIAKQFGTEHTTFKVDANILNLLPKYAFHFDEPFADYAAFPTYVVAELARKYVTVALTGDGGDEIFAGYQRYASENIAEYYKKVPTILRKQIIKPLLVTGERLTPPDLRLRNYFEKAIRRTDLMGMPKDERYIKNFIRFTYNDKLNLFKNTNQLKENFSYETFAKIIKNKEGYDDLSKQLYMDIKTSLPEDMLTKVDRITMAVSLEARVPLLDHRIVELAAQIPSNMKMGTLNLKRFMKRALEKELPHEILYRQKHGFGTPLEKWLRHDMKEVVFDVLSEKNINKGGLFNYDYIKQMLNEHMAGARNNSIKIFMLMAYQMWELNFYKNE